MNTASKTLAVILAGLVLSTSLPASAQTTVTMWSRQGDSLPKLVEAFNAANFKDWGPGPTRNFRRSLPADS